MLDWTRPHAQGADAPLRGLFIAGDWQLTGKDFETRNPATGAVLARVADAGAPQIEAALAAAAAAQPAWEATPPAAKAALFHKAAALFEERRAGFVEALIAETGSGRGKAEFEASLVALVFTEAAGLPTRAIGAVYPSQTPDRINRTMRRPAGVVGAVTPWNFALYLSLRGFIYALALGNTVVLKPSEDSPLSGGLMIAELLRDAGFPAGAFNVLTTSREGASKVGEAFANDPRINVISFTGSTRVGQLLNEACARNFKKIVLELGGKNPMIVLDDADLERAVDIACLGRFLHQGQICMSTDRIIVHESLFDGFVEKFAAKAAMFAPTDPTEPHCVTGPIINARQLGRITALVDEAREKGAQIRCGGAAEGPFFQPTVLTGVTREMAIWREEVFGPVATVVPFSTEAEALALANETEYGLSASVVTRDIARGEMLAERIEAGMVHVNGATVHDEPHCPFAGMGASGGGGTWGPEGTIEAFTIQRWISSQRKANPLPF